jgi:site-specific DNA-cytosine methylase
MHNVNTVSSEERDWIIQNTLYEVIAWIKSFGMDTLVIENLKFLKSGGTKTFNRMSHNFSYSNMIKSLVSIAFKENIALVQVDAYYSSFIGKVKYQQMYGLSIHQAAAFVLARRGLGLKEKMPKQILSVLFTKEVKKGQEISNLFKHWKKAKTWFDEIVLDLKNQNIQTKGMLFSQVLTCKKNQEEELFHLPSLVE